MPRGDGYCCCCWPGVFSICLLYGLAKEQQILLVIVVSPIYAAAGINTQTIRMAKEICVRKRIFFLDYSRTVTFIGKTSLFSDQPHLNNTGAVLFLSQLCNDLRPVFSKKGYSEAKSH